MWDVITMVVVVLPCAITGIAVYSVLLDSNIFRNTFLGCTMVGGDLLTYTTINSSSSGI